MRGHFIEYGRTKKKNKSCGRVEQRSGEVPETSVGRG